ncbi:hypothetical protein [Comamonas kerstersii]|uniref:hypothetical protein n=1 Tax=Comamonas kerstersii TaxID=225992 RepID=UPI001B335D2B|nr:hypothetical protein [Comamonas kerstersii]QTW17835.1 hypothetical protein H8N02_11340 [Comamonas kerstersii]
MNFPERDEAKVQKKRATANCFLIAIALTLFFGWFWVFVAALVAQKADWFARSGSVLTIASLLATLHLSRLNSFLVGECGEMPCVYGKEIYDEFKNIRTSAMWLAQFSTIVGTLVWGYGDLLFGWLTR